MTTANVTFACERFRLLPGQCWHSERPMRYPPRVRSWASEHARCIRANTGSSFPATLSASLMDLIRYRHAPNGLSLRRSRGVWNVGHQHRILSGMTTKTPHFQPEKTKDGRWFVAVKTGNGPDSHIGDFDTEADAERWIATKAKYWPGRES